MPTDYSGIFGFMYSIVGESSTSLSTQVKLVVIGDESSGKDLIIEKFFEESSQQTDGSTDEKFKYIEVHSHKVKVVVQTTGNHEKMLSIAPIFFKQAHGIVYVYDTSDKKSFAAIQKLMNKVRDETLDKKSVLLANTQGDRKAGRAVAEQEGRQKAQDLGVEKYYETNSATGENVKEALCTLAELIVIQRYKDDGLSSIGGVALNR